MEVTVKPEETLETALKRFRRVCQKSGLFAEVKRRARYMKPSERRKLAEMKSKRRALRRERRRR